MNREPSANFESKRGIRPQQPHLPDSFRRIRLELAREPGHPQGAPTFGYLIWAPLSADAKIDASLWQTYRDFFRAVKFRPGKENEIAHLVHGRGGGWLLRYDIAGEDEDEAGFHFQDEHFQPGEYVSIQENGRMHAYKVCAVERY